MGGPLVPGHLAVVIPARNEEQLLPSCLQALLAAVHRLRAETAARASITVVLDSCTDGTRRMLAGFQAGPGADLDLRIVEGRFGAVGAARAAGIASLPEQPGLWIANTDADTVVPENWLLQQYLLASAGYGLVIGTVVPDPADLNGEETAAWHALHSLGEGHRHVHGANMGFSAAAYHRCGGFAPVSAHEDVDLAEQMQAAGVPWLATDTLRAVTSGRRDGRTPDGFSSFLRRLLPG